MNPILLLDFFPKNHSFISKEVPHVPLWVLNTLAEMQLHSFNNFELQVYLRCKSRVIHCFSHHKNSPVTHFLVLGQYNNGHMLLLPDYTPLSIVLAKIELGIKLHF